MNPDKRIFQVKKSVQNRQKLQQRKEELEIPF